MIFTSLLKLIEINLDAVYTFLCKICDESCSELSFDEAQVLDRNLNLFKDSEEKDFPHFMQLFNGYNNLQNKLTELGPDGCYSFLTTGENVNASSLDSFSLILISDYVSIFGSEYVSVLVPHGGYRCHHAVTSEND